jgi:hypothetical protein
MSTHKKVENQIQTLGYELISEFGDELFKILDKRLTPKFGSDWFSKTLKFKKGGMRPSSPKDVHTIVHQVVTEKNNDWRGAIAAEFQLSDYGKYANKYFQNILDSRNKWMHPDDSFSHDHLRNLVGSIHKIFGNRNHPLGDKCEEIFELLRSGSPFSFAIFSRAFGEDYALALRQNQLLREELMKFRENSLNSPFHGDFIEENLQKASRNELLELVTHINNRLAIAKQDIRFLKHYWESRDISVHLQKIFTQIMILIGFVDEEFFFNRPGVEVKINGELVQFSKPLEKSQLSDLMNAYFSELAFLISRAIALSEEAGPDNCTCKVCETYGPVSDTWFTSFDLIPVFVNGLMFNWRSYLGEVDPLVIEELVGEAMVTMQLENNFSDLEMSYVFPEYQEVIAEYSDEFEEYKKRASQVKNVKFIK